jgi:hypothetical protein
MIIMLNIFQPFIAILRGHPGNYIRKLFVLLAAAFVMLVGVLIDPEDGGDILLRDAD